MISFTTTPKLHTKELKEFVNYIANGEPSTRKLLELVDIVLMPIALLARTPLQNSPLEENSFSYSTNE